MTPPLKISPAIERARVELASAVFNGAIAGASDLKIAIERLAGQFDLRPGLVWTDVERQTEAGKLLTALLKAPEMSEMFPPHRRRDPQRERAILNAVDCQRDADGLLPAHVWETAAKKLGEQTPPVLGNGRPPKPMSPASVRDGYRLIRESAASLYFHVIENEPELEPEPATEDDQENDRNLDFKDEQKGP
jgi:hypothetical protein